MSNFSRGTNTAKSRFAIDENDISAFWQRHHDERSRAFMAALMRHFKVTQIEIPMSEVLKDATVEWTDKIDTGTRFYRIVGELKLEGE